MYINSIVKTRSVISRKLKEISNDSTLQKIIHLKLTGWPWKEGRLDVGIKPYLTHRNDQSVRQKILFYQDCIAIPQNLRVDMQQAIHTGHLGLNKYQERAKVSVWWPKILYETEDFIKRCEFRNCHRAVNPKKTLKPTSLPDRPWQKVGTDILKLDRGVLLRRDRLFFPLLGNSEIKSSNK